ncbi:type IV secretion system protein [Aliarcobacter cibarius]|uniref:P-type type IV conjugative transfer system protein TrbL/VirB6 n=1 Tax=Aliarcobacter cibarius TaxID=255507 RepID=A0A5J6RKI3_9BACT|nr:type IV secretion system protein [Aliarcobacter cibarius]QEZ90053.1 P-type type IV conjugative transfer system protein TrbL/VirB6 [Aliarcobacter cibarius]QKJ28059.1 P-type type IV conjugative transfer system protein TrbL/VirB6 [Aliarcobacter cibarius]TLT01345.1 type IV secretion system protein [Aliarcobacter cibarius]TLT01750.1 type IV secretion system protein [Aliarcobacter cibarius]
MDVFQKLGSTINEILNFLRTQSNSDLITTLASLIAITITIQVIFKAYLTLIGKINDPIRDVIFDLMLKMFIAIFALNIGGWLDLVKDAMEQLHNSFSGGENLYAVLDAKLDAVIKLNAKLYENAEIWDGSIFQSLIGVILNLISFMIGIVPAFLVMITTDITLRLILILAPIVIFARLYGWFKNVFTQWLAIFIGNLLTVYMVGMLLNQFSLKYGEFLTKVDMNADKVDAIAIGMQGIMYGFLLFMLLKTVVTIAEKLAQVSIEGVGESGFNQASQSTSNYLKQFRNTKSK